MNARDFDLAMEGTPGGILLKLITGNGKQEIERAPRTGNYKRGTGVREQLYRGTFLLEHSPIGTGINKALNGARGEN